MEERYEADLARSARVLDDVERSLERLGDGTYGSCETCGSPIRASDLATNPNRRHCEQHLDLDSDLDLGLDLSLDLGLDLGHDPDQ